MTEVARAIGRQSSPVILFSALVALAAVAWDVQSGSDLSRPLVDLFVIVTLGVVGSYAVHEIAHVIQLKRLPGIRELKIDRTWWRVTIRPIGHARGTDIALAAFAGPGAAASCGVLLRVVEPPLPSAVAWCFLLHPVFLLPCFADGRSLLLGLRLGRRSREL